MYRFAHVGEQAGGRQLTVIIQVGLTVVLD